MKRLSAVPSKTFSSHLSPPHINKKFIKIVCATFSLWFLHVSIQWRFFAASSAPSELPYRNVHFSASWQHFLCYWISQRSFLQPLCVSFSLWLRRGLMEKHGTSRSSRGRTLKNNPTPFVRLCCLNWSQELEASVLQVRLFSLSETTIQVQASMVTNVLFQVESKSRRVTRSACASAQGGWCVGGWKNKKYKWWD